MLCSASGQTFLVPAIGPNEISLPLASYDALYELQPELPLIVRAVELGAHADVDDLGLASRRQHLREDPGLSLERRGVLRPRVGA